MRFVLVISILVTMGLNVKPAGAEKLKDSDPYWHYVLNNIRSEFPEQEPNDACPGQSAACGDVVTPAYLEPAGQDWYTFYVTAGAPITVGTDAVNQGDYCDTYIELYFECGGTILAQDDDGGPGTYSLISSFTAPYTGNYNLKVRGYNASSTGPYKAFFQCTPPASGACCFNDGHCAVLSQSNCVQQGGTYQGDDTLCDPNPCPQPPPPPENDTCAGAFEIPRCSGGSLQGDNTWANNDYDPGDGGCTGGYAERGRDVAYFMNLVAGDVVDMTYTQLQYDAAFYIVTDCANVPGTCLVGADGTISGQPEVIHWVAPANGTYFVILDCYYLNYGGLWTLDYTITCPPPEQEACCFPDGHCEMLLAGDCQNAGGTPQGQGTTCDAVQCQSVATEGTTWGRIKSSYR